MLIKTKKPDLSITFPQANDIHKIIKFVNAKTFNYYDKYLASVDTDVVKRQINYYNSAANYLGLIDENKPTELAYHIFKLDKNNMLISVVQLILQNEVFNIYYKNRDLNQVVYYLKEIYNISESTAIRRSSTVKAWVNWCDIIIKENGILIEWE